MRDGGGAQPASGHAEAGGCEDEQIATPVLLGRLAQELDAVTDLIMRVEGALGELITQSGNLSPTLLGGLQQIDFAMQGIQDVSRVVTHVAASGPVCEVSDIRALIRMREMAHRVLKLQPPQTPQSDCGQDGVSWL